VKPKIDYTLYLVTDRDLMAADTLEACIKQAVKGGCTLVQLREKTASCRVFYDMACRAREVTARLNVPLIINNRADIALAVNADGVHIGQGDLPYEAARRIVGDDKIIGLSAHTLAQALEAQAMGADYIGVGAMFSTGTKTDARPTAIGDLKEICEAVRVPVVAIGGITAHNAALLSGTGISGIAVVSAIVAEQNAQDAARKIKALFKGGSPL
jgi:thiamine-phosphate pyrophosphorylase